MAEHAIDPEPYLADVHDIDFSVLSPDPTLAARIRAGASLEAVAREANFTASRSPARTREAMASATSFAFAQNAFKASEGGVVDPAQGTLGWYVARVDTIERAPARTLAQVNALRPDRLARFAYAHLPARFKPQRRIAAAELPGPSDKLSMLSASLDALQDAGYVYVGMDHFALPDDALAVAKRQGRLHRNFQGYSTQPDCDLIALGVSAIGRIGATYSQNAKTLEEYRDMLDQGRLPIVRGLALTRDDLLRRAVIMSLMCQGELQFESIELGHLIDFRQHFVRELEVLAGLAEQGLVRLDPTGVQVTEAGWYLVRAIAMVFDKNLQVDLDRARFSKII